MRLVVALLLSLGVALCERQTGEACQPCRSSSACAALSAPFTRQLQTQNLLSWETSIAETVCHAGVCVPEAAEDMSSFCDRLQGKVAAEQEQPAAAAAGTAVLRKGTAEGSQVESAQERRRSLQEEAAQGQQGSASQAESTAQATVVSATANAAGLGAERNETQQQPRPAVATTGASFSVHGSSGASTTAAIRPPVANINLAELARWATGTSPTLQVAGEAAEGTQPVSRSLGEIGFPFLDYGNEGWGSGSSYVPQGERQGWSGPPPPGWTGQPVPPPPGWTGQPVPPPPGWTGQPSPSPNPVVTSPSPKPSKSPSPSGGDSSTGSFGPGSGGNPGGKSPILSPKPHKSPSPKPHKGGSPSPKSHSPSPKPHPPSPPPSGPPGGQFYDPRGGDPTVVFAVSPLSANVDNAYLRAIGANIVAATNLLEVDDDEAGASHFFRQVEDDAPKANVLAYGKGYVELQGTPLRVIPHVMNLEACARHCDADEKCTHWRRCAGGDCGAKLQECELMAAPQEGTPAGASPNTVAPSVLEERAPSVRYIDPAQSNIIMESGTKSPTEFPTALYGCPYPAVPNGQLGQCVPPPQCNCAGGVCYGAC